MPLPRLTLPALCLAAVLATGCGSSGSSSENGPLGTIGPVLKSLPTVSGTWGTGHLLQGTVFSAVLTDDGRLAIGAVAPSALYDALSAP